MTRFTIQVCKDIKVSNEVREKLKEYKIHPNESYEDILRRVLEMPVRKLIGESLEEYNGRK